MQIGAKRAKTCTQTWYIFRRSFRLACHRWWLGRHTNSSSSVCCHGRIFFFLFRVCNKAFPEQRLCCGTNCLSPPPLLVDGPHCLMDLFLSYFFLLFATCVWVFCAGNIGQSFSRYSIYRRPTDDLSNPILRPSASLLFFLFFTATIFESAVRLP